MHIVFARNTAYIEIHTYMQHKKYLGTFLSLFIVHNGGKNIIKRNFSSYLMEK